MGYRILDPAPGSHRHSNLPSTAWWNRWRLGLRHGSVVECDHCGVRWRLTFHSEVEGACWCWLVEDFDDAVS